MNWEVMVSDEFLAWYRSLDEPEWESVNGAVAKLENYGPTLGRPYVDTLIGSKYPNMKELRVQHQGKPYRILFAFDPRRNAYLILGGDKSGDANWYVEAIRRGGGDLRPAPDGARRMNTMAHKWRDVRKPLSPEAEERIQQGVKGAAAVMTLHQLREARSLTQVNLARVLQINQGAVSKMEKRADMYVSTLRSFIQAMGGELQVKAIFPEGEVEIDQFEKMDEASRASA